VSALRSNHMVLAQRAQVLTSAVNQLIADIESDVSAPDGAAFNAKAAYEALRRVVVSLADASPDARSHYEAVAVDAANDGRISEALSHLHKRASQDGRGHLRSGEATGEINGRKVSISVVVGPSTRGTISVHTDYVVDGQAVRVPDLIKVIGGAA
jgi:hypothetical protein